MRNLALGIVLGLLIAVAGTVFANFEGNSGDECFGPETTGTPTPTTTPPERSTPTNTPKPKCNRGIGNLSEDCDPGNSYGQGRGQGRPAGEDRVEADGAPPSNK